MWVFTFGYGHVHRETGDKLANYFVEIGGSHDEAREVMVRHFGTRWCGQYANRGEAQTERHELLPLRRKEWPPVIAGLTTMTYPRGAVAVIKLPGLTIRPVDRMNDASSCTYCKGAGATAETVIEVGEKGPAELRLCPGCLDTFLATLTVYMKTLAVR